MNMHSEISILIYTVCICFYPGGFGPGGFGTGTGGLGLYFNRVKKSKAVIILLYSYHATATIYRFPFTDLW